MKRTATLLGSLSLVALLAIGCKSEAPAPAEEPTAAVESLPSEEPVAETASADPMAFKPAAKGGTLVVGQTQEPETLYSLGGSMLAASHVLNGIYDGPIEGMDYDFQPVILESLPKLENEGATMEMVSVEAGQQFGNDGGALIGARRQANDGARQRRIEPRLERYCALHAEGGAEQGEKKQSEAGHWAGI